MQFSAILDRRTTEICRRLDGIIVEYGSKQYYAYSPPRHWNCRSIWVAIMQDEPYKPKFTKSFPQAVGNPPSLFQ